MAESKAPDISTVFAPETMPVEVEESNVDIKTKMDWSQDEEEAVEAIKKSIDERIRHEYAQAFAIEQRLLEKVRTPVPAGQGAGWVRYADGSYVEDWSRLTMVDIENFIQAASSESFFASQQVIDNYAEAVFAKFNYEDAYDDAYSQLLTGTIGDKTAKAKRTTQKERWMALYRSLYYKKAKEVIDKLDAHVRRVERIYIEKQKEYEREFRASRSTIGGN